MLTHGHEDHVGALPFVLREIGDVAIPDIYGGALTVAMVRSKLDEHKLRDMPLREVEPGDQVELGPFTMEPVKLAHSIPDMFGMALECELGTTFFTGDYKFDQTPVDGVPADVARLAELGREGLLLLCGDSTNADRPGHGAVRVERRPAPRGGVHADPRADRDHLLRVEHPPRPAGGRRGPGDRPQGRARRAVDAQVREHRPAARPHRRARRGCSSSSARSTTSRTSGW